LGAVQAAEGGEAMSNERGSRIRRGRVYEWHGAWFVDFSRYGKRHRHATDAKSEKEAWDILEAERTAVRMGGRLDYERVRFSQIAERLREHYKATGAEPRTLARWNQVIAHLAAHFGNDLARNIPERLDGYIAARLKAGAKPATVRTEVWLVGRMFKLAKLP